MEQAENFFKPTCQCIMAPCNCLGSGDTATPETLEAPGTPAVTAAPAASAKGNEGLMIAVGVLVVVAGYHLVK
jgi:hypothetical protein